MNDDNQFDQQRVTGAFTDEMLNILTSYEARWRSRCDDDGTLLTGLLRRAFLQALWRVGARVQAAGDDPIALFSEEDQAWIRGEPEE